MCSLERAFKYLEKSLVVGQVLDDPFLSIKLIQFQVYSVFSYTKREGGEINPNSFHVA